MPHAELRDHVARVESSLGMGDDIDLVAVMLGADHLEVASIPVCKTPPEGWT